MEISGQGLHFSVLNSIIKESPDRDILLTDVMGQRYIAAGTSDKNIEIHGVPGNALGAYLDGGTIVVYGNAQDQTGDTMNDGTIIIHGSSGDATGYAMRGGKIFIKGNAGYRAGIHMKAYKEHNPVVVIGEKAGDFLGEYQAGGYIIVLGLGVGSPIVGDFCGTGMHGGKMFLRTDELPKGLPAQVLSKEADEEDLKEIIQYIEEFCSHFGVDMGEVMKKKFYMLYPNTKNPYKQLYTHN